jgi:sugar phosphate isomerase/epimerase
MITTRREFCKLAAGGTAAALGSGAPPLAAAQRTSGRSVFAGVHVGVNAPFSFRGTATTAGEIVAAMAAAGASALELRSQPVEQHLGAPMAAGRGGRRGGGAGAADDQALAEWRLALSMDRVDAFRRQYEDAGLSIEIVKYDGIASFSDDVLDYAFRLAQHLGAYAISCEIPDAEASARLGRFADKHKMMVGLHGHASTGDADWIRAFAQGHFNGANVDIGHYVAGHSRSPVPFIQQHHHRITHVHLKDRRMNEGPNVPWGQGDTPIREVLQLIRDNGWRIQATIELEYPVPDGSTPVAEIAKCVQFCREALEG